MTSADCIFCKIGAGAISGRNILESADCVAFLDAAPLALGHSLLVPRSHFTSLDEMPADTAAALMRHLPALGRAILSATGADAYNVLLNRGAAAGQVVMHAHIHIIPRRQGDHLGYRWQPQELTDSELDLVRSRIVGALGG